MKIAELFFPSEHLSACPAEQTIVIIQNEKYAAKAGGHTLGRTTSVMFFVFSLYRINVVSIFV